MSLESERYNGLEWKQPTSTKNVMVAFYGGVERGFIVKGKNGWCWCTPENSRSGSCPDKEAAKRMVAHGWIITAKAVCA